MFIANYSSFLSFTAELIGFQMLDPNPSRSFEYIGPVVNTSLFQIERGKYVGCSGSSYSYYQPPQLELYTQFSLGIYFAAFLVTHFLQIFAISIVDKIWMKKTTSSDNSFWKGFINSVQKSHLPFPYDDWDVEKGDCLDHIERQRKVRKEFLATAANTCSILLKHELNCQQDTKQSDAIQKSLIR